MAQHKDPLPRRLAAFQGLLQRQIQLKRLRHTVTVALEEAKQVRSLDFKQLQGALRSFKHRFAIHLSLS